MNLQHRLDSVRAYLTQNRLDLVVISRPSDIAYVSRVLVHTSHREAMLYITPQSCVLLHSPLLTVAHNNLMETRAANDASVKTKLLSEMAGKTVKRIGIQETDLTVHEFKQLQKSLTDKVFIDASDCCTHARAIKTADELHSITTASRITSQVMDWVMRCLKVNPKEIPTDPHALTHAKIGGQNAKLRALGKRLDEIITMKRLTEQDLAGCITEAIALLGAHELAFPVHVAFDKHSAAPHHTPTNAKLTDDSIVMLDFGAKIDGYCADMTRTFCLSPTPSQKFVEIKTVVDDAYQAAAKLLIKDSKIQHRASNIDAAARKVIDTAGYGKQFPHSTGHGVGLEIHEQPSLSPSNHQALEAGMVVTIEPGIYLEGEFGYRIENTLTLK